MSVVVSLLRAIDRADGEALVMHVGEKPYVVTATGHAELAASALTVPAMTGMLEQLLPADSRQALDELGAVEYHLPSDSASPGTRYSVVAARGGDDIWIEVRRRKPSEEPATVVAPQPASWQAAAAEAPSPVHDLVPPAETAKLETAEIESAALETGEIETAELETAELEAAELEAAELEAAELHVVDEPAPMAFEDSTLTSFPEPDASNFDAPSSVVFDEPEAPVLERWEPPRAEESFPASAAPEPARAAIVDEPPVDETPLDEPQVDAPAFDAPAFDGLRVDEPAFDGLRVDEPAMVPASLSPPAAHEEHRYVVRDVADRFELRLQTEDDFYGSAAVEDDLDADVRHVDDRAPAFDFTFEPEPPPPPFREPAPPHRASVHVESTPPAASIPAYVRAAPVVAPQVDPLHRLLKIAAVQGASALYVAPQSRPSLRVDGEMRVLDEPPMTAGELEAELRSLVTTDVDDGALPLGEFETRELHGVGRVQCLLFRDHRGLGAIFRMLPGRTVSAQKAGLSAGIQSLCTEPEGLLLVAGLQGAGKSTLVAALVDQINRTRRDHVITVESDIQFVHENHTSFISQREARDEGRFLEALRAAIREAPDVLVIDGVMNGEVASTALEAASHGLVVASLAAPATAAALERFLGLVGSDRPEMRALVSEHLRGIVTQALLRKTGGGRAAAREVLVNVPAVATLVANGQIGQLASVLNGGRRIGMVPLNDALLELVQSGALDVRQAYRKSPDQSELVTMLGKAGFDTAFAENLG